MFFNSLISIKKFSYFDFFNNTASITTAIMEEFHDYTNLILLMIISFIFIIMIKMAISKFTNYNFKENTKLEIIWTILPMVILFLIAYPSLYYLYLFDLSINPSITAKVFGAQWYWIYEKFDSLESKTDSSYMTSDLDLLKSEKYKMGWRLLDTDTRMVVPFGTEIQCLATSMDVIHSFSVPDLGVKIDAIPGRLNAVTFLISRPGTFYGQCAEICGTGHSFMPICIEAI